MAMNERCLYEIEALHKCFENWFMAQVENTDENFLHLDKVLAKEFEIIFPDGRLYLRQEVIEVMKKTYGMYKEIPFRIEIKNYRERALSKDLHLTTYEEWQIKDGKNEVKLSTALFQRNDNTPCGVEWLHVHEVYIPGK